MEGTTSPASLVANESGWTSMNMQQAALLAEFYRQTEPMIGSIVQLLNSFIFQGEIKEKWTGLLQLPDAGERERQMELRELLRQALDYRRMFGMCPIKIVNEEGGRSHLVIPDYTTGSFIVRYNQARGRLDVAFASQHLAHMMGGPGALTPTMSTMKPDPDVHVFVWEDTRPTFRLNDFKTPLIRLLPRFLYIQQLRENLILADMESCNPTMITQIRPDKQDITDVQEEDIFADIASHRTQEELLQADPSENIRYRRSQRDSIMMELALKRRREQEMQGTGLKRTKVDPISKTLRSALGPVVGEKRFDLQGDRIMATQLVPRPVANLDKEYESYLQELMMAFGVPSDMGTKSTKQITAATQASMKLLQSNVELCRDACVSFYAFAYSMLYMDEDQRMLRERWESLHAEQQEYERLTSPVVRPQPNTINSGGDVVERENLPTNEQQQRLDRIREQKLELTLLGKKTQRASIEFVEDPFHMDSDIADILAVGERKLISVVEESNLIREKLKLEPVSETDPIIKEALLIRDQANRLQEATIKKTETVPTTATEKSAKTKS